MGLLTVAVCVGRVLALVHTPLDIAGGILVACIGAVWYKTYAKTRLKTHLARRAKK
jgi:membrane-associated phospholipid phosphatase